MKDFESLKTSLKNKILTVSFDRPDKMNTFSGQMLKDILEVLDEAEKNDEIRAVIFTGSGKAFCAGADLSSGEDTFDMSDKGKSQVEVKRDTGGILTLRLFDFKKPLIALSFAEAAGPLIIFSSPFIMSGSSLTNTIILLEVEYVEISLKEILFSLKKLSKS